MRTVGRRGCCIAASLEADVRLIDSTGIEIEGIGEWNAREHGGAKRRVWRKIHIGIDEKPLKTLAAEFTTSDVGDAPMLLEPLAHIPSEQKIGSVTADGAFDTRKCHDAIAARGAASSASPARTPGSANLIPPAQSRATRSCAHQNSSAGRSGDDGVVVIDEAASRRRCTASSC